MTSGEFSTNQWALEEAFDTGGVMETLAQAALEEWVGLSPNEVGEIILSKPAAGESLDARWALIQDTKQAIIEAANQNQGRINDLANQLGMRQETSITEDNIAKIDPQAAIWTIEGGANKTSVVRRQLAILAMRMVYGEDLSEKELYQFGSVRIIPREKGGKPNPEYLIAHEIGSDFLSDEDSHTEFEVNLASALQAGYEKVGVQDTSGVVGMLSLRKPGLPRLSLLLPDKTEKGGLEGGFTSLARRVGSLAGRQLVIATNGQYRPKDETQAAQWAQLHEYDMLAPVAIGDEAGFTASHAGNEITTAERQPMAYVNEIVVLHRLTSRQ